jgi:ADP-heptose:LPS heptosyltransferase
VTNQTTLLQLMWLIRRARWVASVDSGPMHIAAAVTPRLVSIHSWTDPRRVGPYNADAWVWKNGELIRVGELANAPVWKKRRPFRRADVDAIVQLIGTNWSDAASGSSLPDATAKNEVRQ